MRFKIEEVKTTPSVLFVFEKKTPLVRQLEEKLSQYQYQIFSSPFIPKKIYHFDCVFVFNKIAEIEKIEKKEIKKSSKIFFILINQEQKLRKIEKILTEEKIKNIKVVNVDEDYLSSEILEKIFWFLFSKSKERIINLQIGFKKKQKKNYSTPPVFNFLFGLTQKHLLFFVLFAIFLAEIFFVFPLIGGGILLYQGFKSFEKEDFIKVNQILDSLPFFLNLTKKTYRFSRPILSFFYLALFPDNLIYLEENGYLGLRTSLETFENGKRIVSLILKPNKEEKESHDLILRLEKLKQEIDELSKRVGLVYQKINFKIGPAEKLKEKLLEVEGTVNQFKKILLFSDEILGKKTEKKYLILFQNNMELRPGGGFIGSFGIVRFADFTLKELKIEDVYEADGQLKAHVEPPSPIRKYLGQPHWFLRDSNFSPDFQENFGRAEFFLEKELNLTGFDGGIAITTTAIKYLLEAFGEVYLPDYKEKITKDNFYIKTQLYAEKNFFPGSIQKKSFLSSLVRTLLLQLEDVSYSKLILGLKRGLAEKQIVLYFKNEELDKVVNLFGWGGRVIVPFCVQNTPNCVTDSFFAVDANLGVNKANFFISRLINLKVKINQDGKIENLLSFIFKNDSPSEIFPGGTYKNYFQVRLPATSQIKKIIKNGVLVENGQFEEILEDRFKIVGLYFELPPQKSTEIKINYSPGEKIKKGRGIYQLIVQKQIGSNNNDFVLEFYFPKKIFIVNHNFSALAKNDHLIYNTTLSTDRIFFIELLKE